MEPEDDTALLSRVAAQLDAVEAALGRIDAGTYGRCAVCGADIDQHRLAHDATVQTCGAQTCGSHVPDPADAAAGRLEGAEGVLAPGDPLGLGPEHP